MSEGVVSLVGSEEKVPVKILRDSGALDSFIVASVLPFSTDTATGDSVLEKGMGLNVFPVPLHRAVLCSDLVKGEVSLAVRPVEQMESVAQGCFLVMKWLPQGERVVSDAIFQIVVPSGLRACILKTAHDMGAGHVGVKKIYDKDLQYFYWPRLKKDISAYIKTCHTCQFTGKPNQ